LAVDKQQAGVVEKYTRAYFAAVPLLRGLVKCETQKRTTRRHASTRQDIFHFTFSGGIGAGREACGGGGTGVWVATV
jgi:hypothetical protein